MVEVTSEVTAVVTVVPMRPDDEPVAPIVAAHIAVMDTTSPPDA